MPKYDSLEKVSGKAEYLVDLKLPSMLYGKILRSKYPHARINSIDTRRAEELEGVVVVITAKDIPRTKFGFLKDNVALKGEKVLSYRDEIAAVAAVDEETAKKAIELIEVEYERLDAVFDPLEAMKEGGPQIHEETPGNVAKSHSVLGLEGQDCFSKKGCCCRGRHVQASVPHPYCARHNGRLGIV